MSESLQQFLELVRKSELVPATQLDELAPTLAAALASRPIEEHPRDAASRMVQKGWLTDWQARNLLAGKCRGFFVGNYRLQRHLGRGGMGTVYMAEHVKLGRRVALKVLPAHWIKDATYLERFQREARVIASLDHPNIVRAYDFDSINGSHFLVMEFVEGRDLARVIKEDGPLPISAAMNYFRQAAEGLSHAHQRGIVHRDIKPSNMLLDASGCLKLLDLGLARWNHGDSGSITLANQQHLLGTVDYLAPEQALDSHEADHRADIYGLGCSLVFVLTGRPPYPDGTIAEKIAKHQMMPLPALNLIRPDLPADVVLLIQGMLEKQPEKRIQSSSELVERFASIGDRPIVRTIAAKTTALEPAADVPSPPETPPPLNVEAPPLTSRFKRPTRSKRPPLMLWIVFGLLVIVALALAGIFAVQRGVLRP